MSVAILIAAVLILLTVILYLYLIMPRIMAKPDLSVFRKKYFAHRGLFDNTTDHPENSLAAFQRAVDRNFGIELDVQLSKDGIPVVFHDFDLKRICGIDRKVRDLTLAELRQTKLLGSSENVPTLQEALDIVRGRVPLIVELKAEKTDTAVCAAADRILTQYPGIYCIESFSPLVLNWYRRHRGRIMRGQLSDGFLYDREMRRPNVVVLSLFLQFLALNCLSRPDFIAYNHLYENNLSRRLCRSLFGARSAAWTIKSEEQLEKAEPHFDVFIFDSFDPVGERAS